MKYLLLPIHLVDFWYTEGTAFFIRVWKHLILLLEEDLAVFLMAKLLFVPLFHDASYVGRVLSILFRLGRIVIGGFAFVMATIIIIALALYWAVLPALAVLNQPELISRLFFFGGVGIFIIHVFTHPHKKVWQIKKEEVWSASEVKKEDLNLRKLLVNPEVAELFSNLEVELNYFPSWEIKDLKTVSEEAYELAKKSKSSYIGARHFFVAALNQIPNIDTLLLKIDLKLPDFEQTLIYLERKKEEWRKVWIWDDEFVIRHLKGVNRGWLGVPTPSLNIVGEDLTKAVLKETSAKFIRNSGVVEEIINILSQTTGRNVILVGPPGSGKSSFIRHLAKMIVAGDAPVALATKRIVNLDLTKLLSGMRTQGDLADRIKDVFEEVGFAQNIIIVIEEIHELGMGEAGGSLNLYSLLQPYLESDKFQFIGTTEQENYARILEKNGAFARIFRKIEMPAATLSETLDILEFRSINTQRQEKVKVTFIAIKTAIELAQKLIKDRVLPDSAISVLKEATTESVNGWVAKDVVRRVVSSRVKVPLIEVGNVDKNRLLNLEGEIHQRLIDQEPAVKLVSDALRRSATGLKQEDRPIGSFLFVGPTGVGKTELAKTLASVYFKIEGVFIRFDMSEYQNPESVSRLIGGIGQEGLLTEAVRSRPYALLLLDEFEKADPKILTLFLQVLEDGRLTDGMGKIISFENTIIIATSNAASLTIAQELQQGKNMGEIDKLVNDELLKVFKPELINRFDDVVIFKPLSPTDLEKIVRIKLISLKKQLEEKGYLVEFEEGLVSELGQKGFDPVLGARPLRRLIQDTLEAKFSRLILEGKMNKGEIFKAGVDLLS
ncbi:ATP-dependent Clp protease ATP-binding subunit [Candidatus Daviesbacteria bacterium]|nr:ATP-dependent Clp protease ATP-binding subunit [Candidatus Daviesbacteria bacterium]